MSRKRIERRLVEVFGTCRVALAAAMQEVEDAFGRPAYLQGILNESRGTEPEEALAQWALRRGRLWLP